MDSLNKIIRKLKTIEPYNACIPSVWNDISAKEKISNVKFPDYFIDKLSAISNKNNNGLQPIVENSNNLNPTIYNLLVRLTTTFNHSQTGNITNEKNKFKETGTLLKTIALLPYIKSLGADILYLLPITAIGQDGKKGDLGSPYSISNPYLLDENINEPLLEMPIEEQFTALIEAAHNLGIKVVCEFIFRTSSKDCQLAIEHPEWFYWLKKEYKKQFHSPIFDEKTLKEIRAKVENKEYNNLPEPDLNYQKQFSDPPSKVELIDDKIIGTCDNGDIVVIPGAFADYPPDDIQPPWSDVTYLKLYNNPNYNYIAYNTIRMYDNELSQPRWEATALWHHIENIIPYYQNKFGIDGVMIDMGHALPYKLLSRIIAKARRINKDFIFWEENFILNEKSVKQGFNCVLGFLPFDEHNPVMLSQFLSNINNLPIKCFATSETHNTPRTASRKGQMDLSKITYLINKLLPLPTFIHSGFELGETIPVNTGLGFENIDTTKLTVDILPLFSTSKLNWNNENNTILSFIIEVNAILKQYLTDNYTLKTIKTTNNAVIAFEICTSESEKLIFVANYGEKTSIKIDINTTKCMYLLGENDFVIQANQIRIVLKEFSFALFYRCSKVYSSSQ
jgi:glycosidase